MAKSKRPSYYAAPLRSKTAIIEWLMGHQSYHGQARGEGSPLAWNVKAVRVDLDFDHLVTAFRTNGDYGPDERWLDYPEWQTPARAKYEEVKDDIFWWAIEDARRGVTETDCNRCLWRGDDLDVTYGFEGRSGGWLVMTEFAGTKLSGMDGQSFHEWLRDELDFKTLRQLYELTVQNDHDFGPPQVIAEVEYQAAFNLIENACGEIPRPDKTQAELPLHV